MSDALFTGKSEGQVVAIVLLFILFVWLLLWGSFKRGVDAIQMRNSIERTRANIGLPPTES